MYSIDSFFAFNRDHLCVPLVCSGLCGPGVLESDAKFSKNVDFRFCLVGSSKLTDID